MPTTRSRSRATNLTREARREVPRTLEEKLEDIEEYLEKLGEKLEGAFKEVREELDEVWDSHEVLWDWHQRHCDTHKAHLIKGPSILPQFLSDVLDIVAFVVGASLSALLLFGVLTLWYALNGGIDSVHATFCGRR